MCEKIPFVRLVPAQLISGHRPNVEPIDMRAGHHRALKFSVAGDDGADERVTNGVGDLVDPALNDGGEGEEIFLVGQRMIAIAADDRRKQPGKSALLHEAWGAA